ncbi:beta-ketoacyl-ACP synthase II [Vibrio nitrifigilis]|uniref:3-oxoacyl-[acyl-carrier-protein] synthase 2 n=1 Tax=Vibrio nitrifigilis TaxID=2789781 RepID=A0ABS0GKX6_9VIBR|nr:beta-ketoacyl-ACP synthase II [Vibrio nitrifigilis]MBF9003129.1 beta-ketoacyl-ACP synthase II [Vibrio nitrifigilis]
MNSPIVITGMGIISPLGCNTETAWARLISSQSGITKINHFASDDLPVTVAGQVPTIEKDSHGGFNVDSYIEKKEQKKLDRFTCFALAAANQALNQANWFPQSIDDQENTATVIGTGIGGFTTITQAQKTLEHRGYKRLSPFTVPAFLANLAAGNVSIKYGFKGPIGCPVTACAAGIQAIGDGIRMIRNQEANVAIVGGAEACIDPLSLASFSALKALSTTQDPRSASRPFDQQRNGFVMGEGAGILVIETLEHAIKRGATPLAVISGYGTSSDAHHITAGPEDGSGAALAIRRALKASHLSLDNIQYVNAHATSTPVGDKAEIASLRNVFGNLLPNIPISATKSATGHLLGAAGGVESIFTALSVINNVTPPTLNLDQIDDSMQDLNLVPNKAVSHNIDHALCNGFGFGGVNAAIIISKYLP